MASSSVTLNAIVSPGAFAPFQDYHSYQPVTAFRVGAPQPQVINYLEAIDHRSTKLRIPISAIEPTNALEDDGFVPGICRLYLEGRCRQGARCFQVHVSGEVLEELREEAFRTPSCCYRHGAPCNFDGLPLNLTVNVAGTLIGVHFLCPTNFLWTSYGEHGNNHLVVKRSNVCREHRRGLCRFGEECSFLHICREIPLDKNEYHNNTTNTQEFQPYSPWAHPYSAPPAAAAVNNISNNFAPIHGYFQNPGDVQAQSLFGKQIEDVSAIVHSFNPAGFANSSFNFQSNFGAAGAYYGNYQQGASFMAPEDSFASLGSTFSNNKHVAVDSKRPLTVPLLPTLDASGFYSRVPVGQRHNPYAAQS